MAVLTCAAAVSLPAWCSGLKVELLTPQITRADSAGLRIRVSWNDAWNNERNHDTAWVFLSYRKPEGLWRPALLHSAAGHEVVVDIPSDRAGAFLYPRKAHRGSVDWTLELKVDASSLTEVTAGGQVEWAVFGVEMVHIPEGAFWVGDRDPKAIEMNAFYRSDAAGNPAGLFRIESEREIQVGAKEGALSYKVTDPIYQGDGRGPIPEEFPKGFAVRVPEGEVARRIAAVGAAIDHVLGERKRQISGQMGGRVVQRERRRAVWLDRQEILLEVAREGEAIAIRFIDAEGKAGNAHLLQSAWTPGDPVWQGTIDGHVVAVQVRPIANGIRLAHQGVEVPVYVWTEAEAASARLMPVTTASDTGKKLLCPMPGLIVSIAVTEGQEVKAGETLAVVEAMKMQNVLRAEQDGTVKKIHASAGATLAVDALILEFA